MAKEDIPKKTTTKSKDINKRRFIDCYEKRKNILLYGNDFFDSRREFIKNIWVENCEGVDQKSEYFLEDISVPPKNPTTKEELEDKFKKDWIDKYKTIDSLPNEGNSYDKELDIFIASHTHITDRTWRYVDCKDWGGKKVYNELVNCIGDKNDHILYSSRSSCLEGVMGMGYLFMCKGLLFLDNLGYRLGNKEDETYYQKLIDVIRERKENFTYTYKLNNKKYKSFVFTHTKFNWLILYTRINSDFPDWFREEFRETPLPIQLKTEVEQQEGKIEEFTETL